MSSDKRIYPRIDLVFKIKYDADKKSSVTSRAIDLSCGGVAFITDSLLPEKENIDLKIYFEEIPGEIAAKARVVRSWTEDDVNIAAVVFTELDEEDRIIVEEYLGYYEEGIISG